MYQATYEKWLELTDEVENKYLQSQWRMDWQNEWCLVDDEGKMVNIPESCPYCIYVKGVCDDCIVPLVIPESEGIYDYCGTILNKVFTNKTRQPIFESIRAIRKYLKEKMESEK